MVSEINQTTIDNIKSKDQFYELCNLNDCNHKLRTKVNKLAPT